MAIKTLGPKDFGEKVMNPQYLKYNCDCIYSKFKNIINKYCKVFNILLSY